MGNHQQPTLQKVAGLSYEEVRAQSSFEFEIPEDFRLGFGLIIKNTQFDLKFFLQTQTYTLLSQFNQKIEEASIRNKIFFPTIINLIKYNGSEYENKLGKSYKISLLYEFKSYTLQDDLQFIQEGKNSNNLIKLFIYQQGQYTENDLYQIIDSVLSALLIFKFTGIKHGYIQPSSIFMKKMNDQIYYCLNDIQFMNGSTEYKRLLNGIYQGCYLSPKLLVELGQRIENPIHDYEKSEIFSLGVTILECIILESTYLYDFDTFQINFDQLENIFATILRTNKFTSSFLHILRAMLAIEENSRFGYKELLLSLQNQNQKIAFTVDQYIKSLDQPQLKELKSLSPLTFKNTTYENDFSRLYKDQLGQPYNEFQKEMQSNKEDQKRPSQKDFQKEQQKKPQREPQKESKKQPQRESERESEKESIREPYQNSYGNSSKLPENNQQFNDPSNAYNRDSQRFWRQQTQPQHNPGQSQVVIPRPMSTSAQRTPEKPGAQSQVIENPRNLPPTFRNPTSTRIINSDSKDIPKSPIQRIKEKKPNQSTPGQMQRSDTVKKQPQSVINDQDHPFEEQFKRLEQKLSLVQSNILQYKRPSVRSNYVDDLDIDSRLPQSSVIHLHSGNSMFLNDIFKKEDF